MPRRNGTGPQGLGAMTGRGMGYCKITDEKKTATSIGIGLRNGRGYGYGRRALATNIRPLNDDEIDKQLKAQKEMLQMRIKEIDQQLSEK